MSFPHPPGYLHHSDVRAHHLNDSIWRITATVLAVWCVGLLVWVTLLSRKKH